MNRYVRFLCFAVAAGFWGIPLVAQSRTDEAAKVYSAAFDFLFGKYKGEFPKTIVVMDSLSSEPRMVVSNGWVGQPYRSSIDRETIADFERVNTHSDIVEATRFSYRVPVVLLSFPELRHLDSLGQKMLVNREYGPPVPGTFVDALAAKYPHAWGITSVSAVGFNSARTQALVHVRHGCGWSCYHSETFVLQRTGTTWRVKERIPLVFYDGLGPGEVRNLSPDARYFSRVRSIQDSTRKAVADSLVRSTLPRRIRGTITNRQTGRPIPFAQVLLFQSRPGLDVRPDSIPHPNQRVVADRRGRFTISNPAVGGAMLVILCPGKIYFDRPSLGAPGLYVWPGSDTTFNFAAQDLSACWFPTRTHQLEPGWFESAEARNASGPDIEESLVMAAAINHLRRTQSDSRIIGMFTRTMPPCRFDKHCGSLQIPRLVHDRVIDSATANYFRRDSAKKSILKPAFAESLGLRVITDAEFSYLSGEAEWPLAWPARDAETDSTRFWTGFRRLYGQHAAIVSVTNIAFNANRTQALMEAQVDTAYEHWRRIPSRMMLLRKAEDGWTVTDADVGRGATTGAIEGNACVATSAPENKASLVDIEPIDGTFELTIVAAGLNERTDVMLLRVGHGMPARWIQPPPGVTYPPASRAHSFELLSLDGKVELGRTMETHIAGIPGNVFRDPQIIHTDGFYQNLTILSITDAGFSGSYVAGVFGDSDFGYFCARRVSRH